MNLKATAERLGIAQYPPMLDTVSATLAETSSPVGDTALIEALQKEYCLFGEYCDDVLAGARDLFRDPDRLCWARVVCGALEKASCAEARRIPLPASDGTPAGDMLPLLAMIPHIPASIELYRSRGLAEEKIRRLLGTYKSSIGAVRKRSGRPGIDTMYYMWLCIYIKARIFPYDGFNYEVKVLPSDALFLQNRSDKTIMPLILSRRLHKSGLILGSASCEDPADSFDCAFRETDEGFFGCPMENGRALREVRYFPKAEWECILRPGDEVLNIHIPRGTDLSREKTDASFAGALDFARRVYPECGLHALYCCSWLLDPTIGEMLGESSKIAAFGELFTRHPVRSAGREVFSFVFPADTRDYAGLPENTRLERALKALYLDGGSVHAFAGVRIL